MESSSAPSQSLSETHLTWVFTWRVSKLIARYAWKLIDRTVVITVRCAWWFVRLVLAFTAAIVGIR